MTQNESLTDVGDFGVGGHRPTPQRDCSRLPRPAMSRSRAGGRRQGSVGAGSSGGVSMALAAFETLLSRPGSRGRRSVEPGRRPPFRPRRILTSFRAVILSTPNLAGRPRTHTGQPQNSAPQRAPLPGLESFKLCRFSTLKPLNACWLPLCRWALPWGLKRDSSVCELSIAKWFIKAVGM